MALIDVVKCELHDYELCVKFPSEDLRIGSQLVVYPSQIAFFVKGGQMMLHRFSVLSRKMPNRLLNTNDFKELLYYGVANAA